MKTEISRDSYQPEKRYSGVYQQQGRMLTDADWNELVEILKERLNDALKDVVGYKKGSIGGVPRHRALKINDDLTIQPGHIYIDGFAAQLIGDGPFTYDDQPDFPSPRPALPTDYILYADVWERIVTHLMDEHLRDKGLHGADTCTRKQMMAQIKWCPYAPSSLNNINPENADENPGKGDAELTATLLQTITQRDDCDPCVSQLNVDSKVGNYLFRVEVHDVVGDASNPTEITLKWSSENGAEQYEALPDKNDMPGGFITDKWVYEFFDRTSEKHLGVHLDTTWAPARVELREINESNNYSIKTIPGSNETEVFIRRWDGFCRLDLSGDGSLISGVDRGVDLSTDNAVDSLGYVNIGDSFQVVLDSIKLDLQLNGKTFVAGDYWLADVREAEHQANSELIQNQVPQGIEHHYLVLGKVESSMLLENPEADRKYAFPPLTEMTRMVMAGGDGQEVVPGYSLPQPLRVAVANGEWPVQAALVCFEIKEGDGSLTDNDGVTDTTIVVKSDEFGIAECIWTPDSTVNSDYCVKATLVDPDDRNNKLVHPPVYFYTNLVTADQVVYDNPTCDPPATTVNTLFEQDLVGDWPNLDGDPAVTVKDVLDAFLCKLRARHIPYDDPGCDEMTAQDGSTPLPTLNKLLNDDVPGWQNGDDAHITVDDIISALICKLNARHIPYDHTIHSSRWVDVNAAEVATDPAVPSPLSVQDAIDSLLQNLDSEDIKYLLPDCSPDTNTLLSHILMDIDNKVVDGDNTFARIKDLWDALLCHLDAAKLPYNPNASPDSTSRWRDINEQSTGDLTEPNTVQEAIDALIKELESTDITYRVPDCNLVSPPTLRTLLPEIKDRTPGDLIKVDEVLDNLLCDFKAPHLPLDKTDPGLCPELAVADSVQSALKILCDRKPGGGCAITVGDAGEHKSIKAALEENKDADNVWLCLLGDKSYRLTDDLADLFKGKKNLKISGLSASACLIELESTMILQAENIILENTSFLFKAENGQLELDCIDVKVEHCTFIRNNSTENSPPMVLISAAEKTEIYWENNYMHSRWLRYVSDLKDLFVPGVVAVDEFVSPDEIHKTLEDYVESGLDIGVVDPVDEPWKYIAATMEVLKEIDPVDNPEKFNDTVALAAVYTSRLNETELDLIKVDEMTSNLPETTTSNIKDIGSRSLSIGAALVATVSGTQNFTSRRTTQIVASKDTTKVTTGNYLTTLAESAGSLQADTIKDGIIDVVLAARESGYSACLGLSSNDVGGWIKNNVIEGMLQLNSSAERRLDPELLYYIDSNGSGNEEPIEGDLSLFVESNKLIRIDNFQDSDVIDNNNSSGDGNGSGGVLVKMLQGYENLWLNNNDIQDSGNVVIGKLMNINNNHSRSISLRSYGICSTGVGVGNVGIKGSVLRFIHTGPFNESANLFIIEDRGF